MSLVFHCWYWMEFYIHFKSYAGHNWKINAMIIISNEILHAIKNEFCDLVKNKCNDFNVLSRYRCFCNIFEKRNIYQFCLLVIAQLNGIFLAIQFSIEWNLCRNFNLVTLG